MPQFVSRYCKAADCRLVTNQLNGAAITTQRLNLEELILSFGVKEKVTIGHISAMVGNIDYFLFVLHTS